MSECIGKAYVLKPFKRPQHLFFRFIAPQASPCVVFYGRYNRQIYRFSSTSAPQPGGKSTSTTPGHADLNAPPPLLKSKVKARAELRPAPVKPPQLSASSGAPQLVTGTHTQHSHTSGDTAHDSHEPLDHLLRRQRIMDDFASHVLTPCPPGLTKLQSLWFTFRQYAVSAFCSLIRGLS